jgi:transcriptional regulator with XRE-family HTH domain
MKEEKGLSPPYRFRLRAKIIATGFKSQKDFASSVGVSFSTVNNIVNAWRFPGPALQRKIAVSLGLTLAELKDLL